MDVQHHMDLFEYQALAPDSIRLLEFRSWHDSELSFSIHHQRLDSKIISYTALSHTWGTPKLECYIRIEGRYLAITRSLQDALIRVKTRLAKRSNWWPAHLWIDAICINQADRVEKSHQVSLMGHIYSRADKVIAWLGPPKDDSNMRLAVEKLDFKRRMGSSEQHLTVAITTGL